MRQCGNDLTPAHARDEALAMLQGYDGDGDWILVTWR
jgi:hypothetical protein